MKEYDLYLHTAEEEIPFSRCTERESMTFRATRAFYHSIEPIPFADKILEDILFTSISAGYLYEP